MTRVIPNSVTNRTKLPKGQYSKPLSLVTVVFVNIAEQSIDQFPVGFAVWRLTDMVIIYANSHALNIFGASADFIGKASLWDIIGPLDSTLVLAEVTRSNPENTESIQIPYEAFTSFKRQDNGEVFSGWYRAKDIVDPDGVIRHRAAVVFAGYDTEVENSHFAEYVDVKAKSYERELAAKVAHEINNSLAILNTELESLSSLCGVDVKNYLSNSFSRLNNLGYEMRRRAHIIPSLSEINPEGVISHLSPSNVESSAQATSGTRILIVDDEPDLATGLSTIFEIRKNVTRIAHSTEEALSKAQSFNPQAALIDLHLGDENGRDVARALREKFPDIRIVYMTGYSSLMPEIYAANDDVVLKKPFEIATALTALTKEKSHDHIS